MDGPREALASRGRSTTESRPLGRGAVRPHGAIRVVSASRASAPRLRVPPRWRFWPHPDRGL